MKRSITCEGAKGKLGWGKDLKSLAHHLGRISNSCGVKIGPLEPIRDLCSLKHRNKLSSPVHGGCPAWTHLELTVFAHDSQDRAP